MGGFAVQRMGDEAMRTTAPPETRPVQANEVPPRAAAVLLLGEWPAELPPAIDPCAPTARVRWREGAGSVQPNAGPDSGLIQVDANNWPGRSNAFDQVVVTDLGTDIHPLAFFDAMDATLAPGGEVWIKSREEPFPWHNWAVLAKRAGWTMERAASPQEWACMRRVAPEARWRVTHALPRHFPEIGELFKTVFGHELTESLWHWKYGGGRGNAVLVRRAGQLVAHYGGMYRDVLNQGVRERVAQIGDVMVAADERGVLTRSGPFALMGATWPEVYGPKGFGFPTDRAFRIAEKLGIYARAGEMFECAWPASHARPRWATRARHLTPADRKRWSALDGLWQAMCQDFADAVIGVRTAAYIEHRFLAHPHHRYDVVAVQSRWTGKMLGAVVLRRHADHLEWLDYIGPIGSLGAVVDQVRRLAALWNHPRVTFWTTERYTALFSTLGAQQRPLGLLIPASCWPDADNPQRYAGRWWLTAGDTDFR